MKTQFISMIIFAILLAFPAGCGKEDSLCGTKSSYGAFFNTEKLVSETLDPLTGNRILIFEDLNTPENICTDEHVTANFYVSFYGRPDVIVTGKAYWGLFEREVELSEKGIFSGTIKDIGLKQAFGTDPGWIGLQIKLTFPTKGSLALDMEEVAMEFMRTTLDYYEEIVPAE